MAGMTEHPGIPRDAAEAIDRVLERSLAMVGATPDELTGPAVNAALIESRDDSRLAREILEQLAEAGEPDLLRQLRTCLRMVEASADVCVYAWQGGDRGYDVDEWARLGGKAVANVAEIMQAFSPSDEAP